MSTPELRDYVGQCRAAGMNDDAIKSSLAASGWSPEAVMAALNPVVPPASPTHAPMAAASSPQAASPAVVAPAGKYQMPGMVALLKEAFALFRTNVKPLYALFGIMFVLSLLSLPLGMLSGGARTAAGIVMFLAQTVFGAWVTAAGIGILLGKESSNLKANLATGAKLILPILIAQMLAAILAAGSLITIIGPALLSVWCLFVPYLVVDDDVRGMKAIVRGRELTRDRWWMIVGYGLGFGLMMIVLAIPALIIMAGVGFALGEANAQVTELIGYLVISPYYLVAAAWYVSLYKHVKAARGPIEPFPKPGQMKWYWIFFGLGIIIPAILFAALGATLVMSLIQMAGQ